MNLISLTRTIRPLGRRSREATENFRDRRIRELVAHAYAHVPFYRSLYDRHGVNPAKVRGFGDLTMLPVATREEIQRARPGDLVAAGVDPTKLRVRRTNGTTGEPLAIRRTSAESLLLRQYYFQAFRSIGVRRNDLAVRTALPRPGEVELGESVLRRTANRLGIYPTASILASHPSAVLKELIRLEPAIVGGVPGGLSLTAARWTDAEREKVRSAAWPRLVVTGGELLKRQTRAHLAEVFAARVIDMYSSVEFDLIASECLETGHYHVSDETVALEIIEGSDHAGAGQCGQPVGTALHSFAAPLVRFPLSDSITAGESTCACGMNLSTIRDIQGRSMDYLELPDGTITHDQKIEEAVGHAAGWVRQIQVSQPAIDRLVLRLAPLRTPSADELDRVRTYLEQFLNHAVKVEVTIDPNLGPQGGEKFLSMIPLRNASSTNRSPGHPSTPKGE
jgi:phenylacetate-CoA ligase